MRGRAAPPHPRIYRVPPPPRGFVVARGRGPIQILKYFRPGYFVSPKTWPWFQILSTLIFKLGLETA